MASPKSVPVATSRTRQVSQSEPEAAVAYATCAPSGLTLTALTAIVPSAASAFGSISARPSPSGASMTRNTG
jgi:hypothetical protein